MSHNFQASLQGESQFINFEQTMGQSLTGTSEHVHFISQSNLLQQHQKQSNQHNSKPNSMLFQQEEAQNQFMEVSKWAKTKNNLISPEMARIQQHMQTKISNSKWAKKNEPQPTIRADKRVEICDEKTTTKPMDNTSKRTIQKPKQTVKLTSQSKISYKSISKSKLEKEQQEEDGQDQEEEQDEQEEEEQEQEEQEGQEEQEEQEQQQEQQQQSGVSQKQQSKDEQEQEQEQEQSQPDKFAQLQSAKVTKWAKSPKTTQQTVYSVQAPTLKQQQEDEIQDLTEQSQQAHNQLKQQRIRQTLIRILQLIE